MEFLKNANIYRVNGSYEIETITVSHEDKDFVSGPSNVRNERVVPRERIETDKNPMPNGTGVRYFNKKQSANNYIHNALVHEMTEVQNASDKEIIDMLMEIDMEAVPAEVSHAIANRAEIIKKKLS